MKPVINESFCFFLKSKIQYWLLRWKLRLKFFKYIFNHKIQKNWKQEGDKYFKEKEVFETYKETVRIITLDDVMFDKEFSKGGKAA